jgi:hypothetical protein
MALLNPDIHLISFISRLLLFFNRLKSFAQQENDVSIKGYVLYASIPLNLLLILYSNRRRGGFFYGSSMLLCSSIIEELFFIVEP